MIDVTVIDALERQVDCYRRLAKLAELQHVHVQQNQTDALLEVLESRRRVLDEIGALERALVPAKQDWAGFLNSADGPDRARAESLLSESKALLARITGADQDDVLVLQQRKLNVGREIAQAASARQVNRSYGAAAYGSPAVKPSRMDLQR